jgi:hypothetical protein
MKTIKYDGLIYKQNAVAERCFECQYIRDCKTLECTSSVCGILDIHINDFRFHNLQCPFTDDTYVVKEQA